MAYKIICGVVGDSLRPINTAAEWLFKWVIRLLFIAVLVKLWCVLDVYDVEKKSKPKRGMIEVYWEGPKGPFFMPEREV